METPLTFKGSVRDQNLPWRFPTARGAICCREKKHDNERVGLSVCLSVCLLVCLFVCLLYDAVSVYV